MQLLVRRLLGQLANSFAQLRSSLVGELVEGGSGSARLELVDRPGGVVEEGEVLVRPQSAEQAAPATGALGAQGREQRRCSLRVLPAELGGLGVEAREQHVEVAHLAEDAAQLLQPPVELDGVARHELPPRAKQGSQAADADAHVVKALGIAAQPCARVVPLDLGQLVAQTAA